MPFPSEKDSNFISGRRIKFNNISQKLSSTDLQSFEGQSRKDDTTEIRHGDDIMGNMTRLNFQNTETHKQFTGTFLPKLDTVLNLKRLPTTLNLELLSPAAIGFSPPSTDTSGDTSRWADSISTQGFSSNNLISLGESPPNLGDESGESELGWKTKGQRKSLLEHLPTLSPTISRREILSSQFNVSESSDTHNSQALLFDFDRGPTLIQSRKSQNTPLPHQLQPLFPGVPKVDFMQTPQASGVDLNESEFYCGFDVLWKEKVVIIGFETGLDIFEVTKKGISRTSRLNGLRGGVFNAKIIPWTANFRNSGPFPLIALVIHGPAKNISGASNVGVVSENVMSNHNGIMQDTTRRVYTSTDTEYYQTSVELYSLSGSKKHIGTLLSLPKIPLVTDKNSDYGVSSPVGSLTILADCGNLIVTSGITGETWIFKQFNCEEISNQQFKCIGKVWTSVQQVTTTEGLSEKINDLQDLGSLSRRKKSSTSILSLKSRWLAFCPPTPSSQTCLCGVVTNMNPAVKIPGLATKTAPNLPEVNCGTKTPGAESMVKQIAQVGTQNFIRAGTYIAQQGFQAWTNYRSKPATTTHKKSTTQINPSMPSSFTSKDPGLVSVLDLEIFTQSDTFLNSSSVHPNFTFRVPYGCSFLSFSPHGLSLFTASSKGDIQFVWDLMQICYPKNSLQISDQIATGTQGPHIRQIAQFSRMTIARIVDVVWAIPNGERAAMVTEPGTIHILDLPTNAFKWPPLSNKTLEAEDLVDQTNNSSLRASSVATSAVNSLWTAAIPLVSNRRRSSTCLSTRSISMTASHSTQKLAAGISRSVGAATEKMNEIRKSIGIKLHLPRSLAAPNRNCIIFQNKKGNDIIFTLAGSMIRIYTVRKRRTDESTDKQKTPVKEFVEYKIPRFSKPKFSSDLNQEMRSNRKLEFVETEIDEKGQKSRQASLSHRFIPSIESSIPYAEIESNAPYRPFHTDRFVRLYTYNDQAERLPFLNLNIPINDETVISHTKSPQKMQAWVFGNTINAIKIDLGKKSHLENKFKNSNTSRTLSSAATESIIRVLDSTSNVENLIITTKLCKSSPQSDIKGIANEDGFFEDDCELLDFAKLRK
ncbi:hypothetical protein EV44_g6247 [Erysiphe necator]|uniref:Uncharacterized protein n=1 Tax=Uncinula necator TaxID=52586 RepID=A0A0B1P4G3_UNCNE|nr:hypothetical protein EV44_g6247 [Erysiphe necator]